MDEFSNMNYRELQKIAKTAGVKANLPKAEILKALRDNAVNGSFLTDDEDPPITDATPSSGNYYYSQVTQVMYSYTLVR